LREACASRDAPLCERCQQTEGTEPESDIPEETPSTESPSDGGRKGKWLSFGEASKAGMIAGAICVLGWISLLFDKEFGKGISGKHMPLVLGVCLLLRSFLPGLTWFRAILVVVGGALFGVPVSLLLSGMISYRSLPNLGALSAMVVAMVPGAVLLQFAFHTKKGDK
jgi:hypothetical protein